MKQKKGFSDLAAGAVAMGLLLGTSMALAAEVIAVDLGVATGFWARMNDATWVKLHPWSSESLTAGELD